MNTINILMIIALVVVVIVMLTYFSFYKDMTNEVINSYRESISIYEEQVANYEALVSKHKEWHDLTRKEACRALLSEACALKAVQEFQTQFSPDKGIIYSTRWMEKRDAMLEEFRAECDARDNKDLFEIQTNVLEIVDKIYTGELDIKRD